MSLMRGKSADLPTDAIRLTEKDAYMHQAKLVKRWKTSSDVWAIRHGSTFLGASTAFTAIFMNNHFRTRLRLMHYARMSTYLPVVFVPTLSSVLFHSQVVLPKVLLLNTCPLCVEIKSGTVQVLSGFVMPLLLAPAASLSFAVRYNTYKVPLIVQETEKLLQMLKKFTKPISGILIGLFLWQACLASGIAYFEMKCIRKVQDKLYNLEMNLESSEMEVAE